MRRPLTTPRLPADVLTLGQQPDAMLAVMTRNRAELVEVRPISFLDDAR